MEFAVKAHRGALRILKLMQCWRYQRTSEEKREHKSWFQWWGWGRQEVHSTEVPEFKVAVGVFPSWKFTWEWAQIEVSAGWPKSQRKKTENLNFRCQEVAIKDQKERGWSGGERGAKGGDESEGPLSVRPSRVCGGRERSAHDNLRKDTQKGRKTKGTYRG